MIDARFLKSSIFFGLSLLSIQGTAYLLQVIAASQMSPADYNVARVTESAAAVGALIVSFGTPSAILVLSASAKTEQDRANSSIAAVMLLAAFAALLVSGSFLASVAPLTIGLALLVSFRLFVSATAQARQDFRVLALVSVFGCAASLVIFAIMYAMGMTPFACWAGGRLVLELVVILGLLLPELRRTKSGIALNVRAGLGPVVALALPLGASLALRAIFEHGPIMWLAYIAAPVTVAAQGELSSRSARSLLCLRRSFSP